MEIRVLRYFLAVVREQNISRAAEALHITQPTLSRQIAELEEDIGRPLFVRGRRLVLTEAGMMLRRRAEEAVALIDKIETEFRHGDEVGGTIAVGSGVYAAGVEVIRALADFSLVYPNVQYEIEDYRDVEILNMYQERRKKGYAKEDIMRSIYAKGRDNARTPMQWDDTEHAGFTDGIPWMKVNSNYKEINAKSQVKDPDSIFSCYKKLIQLRKQYPVFVDGNFTLLLENDENIFAYQRKNANQTMVIICNFFDKTVNMPLEEMCKDMELLLGNYKESKDASILRPYEARIYIK